MVQCVDGKHHYFSMFINVNETMSLMDQLSQIAVSEYIFDCKTFALRVISSVEYCVDQ